MAETVGWLTDKIIITELKIYHTSEKINGKDTPGVLRSLCRKRLKTLKLQRDDLKTELSKLYLEVAKGKTKPKIYRQFKMYNDPRFIASLKARGDDGE